MKVFTTAITFFQEEVVSTEEGEETVRKSFRRKADINFKGGKEINQSQTLAQTTSTLITVYFDSQTSAIDSSWKIEARGSLFEIISIIATPGYSPRYLEIQCVQQPK